MHPVWDLFFPREVDVASPTRDHTDKKIRSKEPDEKIDEAVEKFDKKIFGINYDTGNSAYMGYNLEEEFKCYGQYIKGVHIKDRVFNGKSVRLGRGDVNFAKFFIQLKIIYKFNMGIFR